MGLTQRVENIHKYIEHELIAKTSIEINATQYMSKERNQNLKNIGITKFCRINPVFNKR